MTHAGTVTLMFTDLVNSTELLHRAGDESAQRIFEAHHKLLSEAVAANGGQEVKWLGDGLMAAFPSAADAVRCAIAMQQSARHPAAGERLSLRVGLHVGEALIKESDYFGTAVVVARRLCERAASGQILCSALVAGLLAGRQAFDFQELGAMELKGLATPVAACEVLYQRDDPAAMLARTPFVGRDAELARLAQRLDEAKSGRGSLAMVVGEPGIGKTRTAEEFAERARTGDAVVVRGRCYEGDATPPYGPFSETLAEYARTTDTGGLRADLGYGAAPIARLVPTIRERLPDISEPVALSPDEERFRLFDAISQFLVAASARAPLVLMLDDLHWADKGTIAMLLHFARFVAKSRILVLGAYRDVELDRQHPLAGALGSLRREPGYERVMLKGLAEAEVGALLETVAEQQVNPELVRAISAETDGNPFFIREVLLHLVEEKKIFREDGRWTSKLTIAEMGIPEGVREVIGRRLSRLSGAANRLLASASGFNGVFRFDIAASVAELEEREALRALDEALDAQILKPASAADSYDSSHALIRHTLYSEQNPSRQVRLHRQIAEAMERVYAARAREHAAEIAYQYHRSGAIQGAERGADYATAAADLCETAYAREEVVALLRIALDLIPPEDPRRPRLLGRLAVALAWTMNFDEAVKIANAAGDLIASVEGPDAAAEYLRDATGATMAAGFLPGAWELARRGLGYARNRDATWAQLMAFDINRRESEDPDNPGIQLDSPEKREVASILSVGGFTAGTGFMWVVGTVGWAFKDREEVLAGGANEPNRLTFWAGEFRSAWPLWQNQALVAEREGDVANALRCWAQAARCQNALGDLAAARESYARGIALAGRLPERSVQALQLLGARIEMLITVNEGWEEFSLEARKYSQQAPIENRHVLAAIVASAAQARANLGRVDEAMAFLSMLPKALDRAPHWAPNYLQIAADAATTLWLLGRTDHIEVIERSIRDKVVAPDLRYPMRDGRLSLARLCALRGRYDEAVEWFNKSRIVLEEQGARPLRAIADFDVALMYARRGTSGDAERARPLLAAAIRQFESIGMTGWLHRTRTLSGSLSATRPHIESSS